MRTRKPAIRTCTGCGQEADKRDLVRVVRTPEGDVLVDETGKANGRGAYVHPRPECFEAAARKRRLAATLKVELDEDGLDKIRREFEKLPAVCAQLSHKDQVM